MVKGDVFMNLEKVRLEILHEKIESGISEFKQNPAIQWTALRCEKTLLETLLNLVEKEIEQKYKVIE